MGVLIVISVAVLMGMLYLGLYLALEWDLESRLVGICTTAWVAVALYLFVFQWLFVREHEAYGLVAITLLSTAGYLVGKTLTVATRREWIEQ
jgi:hypothetical protein